MCEKTKWSHRNSPIIWRELLDRGGEGLLLGGYNEFLEYAQVCELSWFICSKHYPSLTLFFKRLAFQSIPSALFLRSSGFK